MITQTTDDENLQRRVVAMYERHPFPAHNDKFRKTSEEMYLKMRLMGLTEEQYLGKKILDCGCGTGEFTCWYASQGNEVTAIDLSQPSLDHARNYAERYELDDRISFQHMSVLDMKIPSESFDIVYSYGVLHHTPDPYLGFENMVKVCKPGGIVIVSVYSLYSRYIHRLRQRLINLLAGEDFEKRMRWGKRLFPITARKLKLQTHDESDAVLYDQFSIPHESLHTVSEVLSWVDRNGLEFVGAFGPLKISDYLYAACLPEYGEFEKTFDGSFFARTASRVIKGLSRMFRMRPHQNKKFERPSRFESVLVQIGWFFLGIRFSCFSIAARKPNIRPTA